MIVSDFTVSTSNFGVNFLEEARSSSPIGCGPWRPFIAGDYITDGMTVRYRMHTFAQSSYTINSINVTIDVQDIIERRVNEVISGITPITFNRAFHAPPQMFQTQFGVTGGAGVEHVLFENITKLGCDIRITDGTTNFSGDVDWVAHGY